MNIVIKFNFVNKEKRGKKEKEFMNRTASELERDANENGIKMLFMQIQ